MSERNIVVFYFQRIKSKWFKQNYTRITFRLQFSLIYLERKFSLQMNRWNRVCYDKIVRGNIKDFLFIFLRNFLLTREFSSKFARIITIITSSIIITKIKCFRMTTMKTTSTTLTITTILTKTTIITTTTTSRVGRVVKVRWRRTSTIHFMSSTRTALIFSICVHFTTQNTDSFPVHFRNSRSDSF